MTFFPHLLKLIKDVSRVNVDIHVLDEIPYQKDIKISTQRRKIGKDAYDMITKTYYDKEKLLIESNI